MSTGALSGQRGRIPLQMKLQAIELPEVDPGD